MLIYNVVQMDLKYSNLVLNLISMETGNYI
jgi:hypothetical protein